MEFFKSREGVLTLLALIGGGILQRNASLSCVKETAMTSTDFGNSGALARVGPIGRVVRILAGIIFLAFFVRNLTRFGGFVDFAVPTNPGVWIGAAMTFYFLADVVNLGFTRTWGRWPQLATLLLALVAALFDLAYYGSVWGPPLGLVVFLMIAYVTVHLGVSFIIAGISAAPG